MPPRSCEGALLAELGEAWAPWEAGLFFLSVSR